MIKRRGLYYVVLALPASIFVFGLFGYLLGHCLYLSFREYTPLIHIDKFVGLANYKKILTDRVFLTACLRNLIYMAVIVGANVVIGFGSALLVNKSFKGHRTFRTILIMPMLLIPTGAGIVWAMLYNYDFGVINHLLEFLGLGRKMFLSSPKYAFWSVVITDIWAWTPFVFLILLAGLQNLPKDPFEAAKIDGVSSWQSFVYITLPLMKPVFGIAIILKSIDTFRSFDYMWVMTKGGPGNASQILSTITYRTGFRTLRYGLGSAMSVVSLLISLVFSIFLVFLMARERRR